MGSKNLKAIVVAGKGSKPPVAHPKKLEELTKYLRGLGYGAGYGLGGRLKAASLIKKRQICYGCIRGCGRSTQATADGIKAKFGCQNGFVYMFAADAYYGKRTEVPFHATRLCHNYGLDTRVMWSILRWLTDCYKAGVLTDENTGLLLSKYGSWEFIESLVKKISLREGFGDLLAQGVQHAADSLGGRAKELIAGYLDKNGQHEVYGPRLYNISSIFFATEPRMPVILLHEMTIPLDKWKAWSNGAEGAYMSYGRLREIGKRFGGASSPLMVPPTRARP